MAKCLLSLYQMFENKMRLINMKVAEIYKEIIMGLITA